eukprot:CAMPEP_0206296888 /NCGR_PEP_ID=MMETSP0106_2-20121207/5896_1 /ASSEMBLY_ACC=CAM_ASM_000206 /TAXON_ID=81532 /ORGANISM="Acanthoeca-like sp., Strain 10tr" /LENGTH=98 /DNA_ID=CAMNT_0053727551 /DNA_START=460 /DNA_END=756 /DNA_ORIENTATION=-
MTSTTRMGKNMTIQSGPSPPLAFPPVASAAVSILGVSPACTLGLTPPPDVAGTSDDSKVDWRAKVGMMALIAPTAVAPAVPGEMPSVVSNCAGSAAVT